MADYNLPSYLRYSREDEWVRVEDGGRCVIGITDFAQQQLGDIVFVELPDTGARIEVGGTFGVIESVKAVSDLFTPVGGIVAEVNVALEDAPETVNQSCYEEGWIIALENISEDDLQQLMSADEYAQNIAERDD